MKNHLLLLCVLLLCACSQDKVNKTERQGEPDIYTVTSEDKAMNDAVQKAKTTLAEFDKALTDTSGRIESLSLKVRFPVSGGINNYEHMWTSDVSFSNGIYTAIVANEPEATTAVRYGDTIRIEAADISDWMYLEKGKLRGGYTIRAIRDRMSAEEKKQFDAEMGFIIE